MPRSEPVTVPCPRDGASNQAAPKSPSPSVSEGSFLTLGLEQDRLPLKAGLHAIAVRVPADAFVTLGVFGEQAKSLKRFEIIERGFLEELRAGTRQDDGLLPGFIHFVSDPSGPMQVIVVIEAGAPTTLARASFSRTSLTPPPEKERARSQRRELPLVGVPFPRSKSDGYVVQTAPRYAFLRADVSQALLGALEQTRTRFRRNPIAIGDGSQWNSGRPAIDIGRPRHISHAQGRDVDIGLPSREDTPSWLERRCEGVLIGKQELVCGPGTVKGLDALRLAYFLGLLIDGPTPGGRHVADRKRRKGPIVEVEAILTDQAYIDAIRRATDVLKRRRWIHDEAYAALGEEGLLRPSPWHVDHVHIRFVGREAQIPAALKLPIPSRDKSKPSSKR